MIGVAFLLMAAAPPLADRSIALLDAFSPDGFSDTLNDACRGMRNCSDIQWSSFTKLRAIYDGANVKRRAEIVTAIRERSKYGWTDWESASRDVGIPATQAVFPHGTAVESNCWSESTVEPLRIRTVCETK